MRLSLAPIAAAGIALSVAIELALPTTVRALPDLGGVELSIASETTYSPFEFANAQGEIVGFDVDLLEAICDRLNCTATFVSAEFEGIFSALAAGQYDAIASATTITRERSRVVDFTRPYLNAGQIVTVRVESDIVGPADLTGKAVGVQLGTVGDMEAGIYTDEIDVRRYSSIEQALAALARGDVEAVIADAPTAGYIVARQFADRLKLVGKLFTVEYYGIALRKETPEMTEAMSAAIAQLAADGTLAQIAKAWGIPAIAVMDLPESGL
ncbi:basic amino acid ABC transporter substrate-binding protein [Synechococcus sp. PCC 7336]|uniref:basic amino acid ABC transporter substrate-binding protein n=1 Tax=Synechococcus sp. PCC 7336 TaxID=195250 RepID=UPI00034570B9|nr:basic amino acid ABC transporter substrate-binding protein [Synechococcus sp. PCC 7336]